VTASPQFATTFGRYFALTLFEAKVGAEGIRTRAIQQTRLGAICRPE